MPLTTAQIELYGKKWGRACKANGWRMERGRLQGADSATRTEHHREVFALAETHALQHHRRITAEDLRRACTAHAAGRFISTKGLTNSQFDHLLALLNVLAVETDIGAGMRLADPAIGERKRLVASLKKRAHEAKLLAIARNLKKWTADWEDPFWEDMPLEGLRTLSRIISREQREWNAPAVSKRELVEEPF